jgi:hypothetical protein
LLQVSPGAGEEPAEVQQPDEEQAVVLRVRHVGAVFVVLQKSPRKHRAHRKIGILNLRRVTIKIPYCKAS